MIDLSVVSYTNALPFLHGLNNYKFNTKLNVNITPPHLIANQLINNTIDIGLVPVAIIPQLSYYKIITPYGICCDGAVQSVQLFSNKKISEIKTIAIDNESNTSNRLCKILVSHYWKMSCHFVESGDLTADAYIIIGDRALAAIGKYNYQFDLGEAWKKFTGNPFVFAAWICNKPIDDNLTQELTQCFSFGINSISSIISNELKNDLLLSDYLQKYIQYKLPKNYNNIIEQFLYFDI